jgi:NADPH:quinone reductase-like Zn-dependent oxidoreductase
MSAATENMLTEVVLPGVVEPDGLVVQERRIPTPGPGQALVTMLATGVSFAEQGMRRGRYPGQPKFPFVLGYDLVGVVEAVGEGVDAGLVGRRVAAVTKIGAWSTHVLVAAGMLVAVPDGVDPAEAETVVVNGVTAWQLLHRTARVHAGQTVLVHGAGGGVGTTLAQLARHAGVRVIGTAAPRQHDALRAMGVDPVDYHDPALADRVRALAPDGVDAAFDHLGFPSFTRSFGLLAPDGTLVGYGTAARRDDANNVLVMFLGILARFTWWSVLPHDGRGAAFYNLWGGQKVRPRRFRRRMRADLGSVLRLLADGAITPHVAARIPLRDAGKALAMAESKPDGKVVLVP